MSRGLNALRDEAFRIAREHGFKDATIGEDVALMHSELSELLEDHRNGKLPDHMWWEAPDGRAFDTLALALAAGVDNPKPCGIPSEAADVIIRMAHFCGKHGIDLEGAVELKMAYNVRRPFMHGGKKL